MPPMPPPATSTGSWEWLGGSRPGFSGPPAQKRRGNHPPRTAAPRALAVAEAGIRAGDSCRRAQISQISQISVLPGPSARRSCRSRCGTCRTRWWCRSWSGPWSRLPSRTKLSTTISPSAVMVTRARPPGGDGAGLLKRRKTPQRPRGRWAPWVVLDMGLSHVLVSQLQVASPRRPRARSRKRGACWRRAWRRAGEQGCVVRRGGHGHLGGGGQAEAASQRGERQWRRCGHGGGEG